MRKIGRCFLAVLVSGIVLLVGACNNIGKDSSDKSLYEHGLDVITLVHEMSVNESYIKMYTSNSEVKEIVNGVAKGDYTEPEAVYQITIPDDKLLKLLGSFDEGFEGMSATLKEYVMNRVQNSIPNIINGTGGTDMVVASSICNVTKTFVSDEQIENIAYLYTYENAVPVLVTFIKGEDGAVSAYGSCIFHEDFLTDADEKIEQALSEFDIEVKEIKG